MKGHSDQPAVGEWATVVKDHCGKNGMLGLVVRVAEIAPAHPSFYLRCQCGAAFSDGEAHALLRGMEVYHPLRWLKRLPPPAEVIAHDLVRAQEGLTVGEKLRVSSPDGGRTLVVTLPRRRP